MSVIQIMKQKNIFDRDEYLAVCLSDSQEPEDVFRWSRSVAVMSVATKKYPDVTPSEAYMKFIAEERGKSVIEKRKIPESRRTPSVGLGDTIKKITDATGLTELSEMYAKITGKPCRCKDRQEALNKLLPYI